MKKNHLVIIFLIVFLSHSLSPVRIPGDTRWTIPTSKSLINEGNFDLNEYKRLIKVNEYHATEKVNGSYYNYFPLTTSVIAIPFVVIFDQILYIALKNIPNLKSFIRVKQKQALMDNSTEKREYILSLPISSLTLYPIVEIFISSFLIALSSIFIYLLALKHLAPNKALLIVFVFAFCSPLWSNVSRALYSHSPSILLITISIFLLQYSGFNKRRSIILGILVFTSYLFRPMNSIFAGIITFYVFYNYRKHFVEYISGGISVILIFVLYNYLSLGQILPNYYLPGRIGTNQDFFEALLGNIISPSRGIFVFSPIFIFSLITAIKKVFDDNGFTLERMLFIIIILHWVIISTFPHWWAGYSIGPRLFSDMIPLFVFFLIIFLKSHQNFNLNKVKIIFVFFALVFSFITNFRGATSESVYNWNYTPVSIDKKPSRVWDITDPQFLR